MKTADRLIRVGALVFAVGVVAALLVIGPFLLGSKGEAPLGLSLTMLALPVGLGIALLGLLVSSHE